MTALALVLYAVCYLVAIPFITAWARREYLELPEFAGVILGLLWPLMLLIAFLTLIGRGLMAYGQYVERRWLS